MDNFCCVYMLFLFKAMVYGQAPVNRPDNGIQLYLPYVSQIISNFSMVYASQFYDVDHNSDSYNDGLWCQSDSNRTNIGAWYFPNGTQIPLFAGILGDSSSPSPLFTKQCPGQIVLGRKGPLIGLEGLYVCVIPDVLGINQTLVVGLYADTSYNKNDGPRVSDMKYSLESVYPQVFTLAMNVSNGPPTNVTCSIDESTAANSTLVRKILRDGNVSVVVTVTQGMSGHYQCIVSNTRVANGTIEGVTAKSGSSSLNISIAEAPLNLTHIRLHSGLTHIQLSWSHTEKTIYSVYIKNSSREIYIGTSFTTTFNITSGLSINNTYDFFVVSHGYDGDPVLPSPESNITTVNLTMPSVMEFEASNIDESINLTWVSPNFAPDLYNLSIQCWQMCDGFLTKSIIQSTINPNYNLTNIDHWNQCNIILYGEYVFGKLLFVSHNVNTTIAAPTLPVENVTTSSIKARSMTIHWSEVPCSGQNGPITGYLIQYSTFTVNITSRNTSYNLISLQPYTNYSIIILPYNSIGIGPANQETVQLTSEAEPGAVINLREIGVGFEVINVTWCTPNVTNGKILFYEISENESSIGNTTDNYYSITNILPNTDYSIKVRAYTVAGPGEWTGLNTSTTDIPILEKFSVALLNKSTVYITWNAVNFIENTSYFYNIYYTNGVTDANFVFHTNEGIISGLENTLNFTFSVSINALLKGIQFSKGNLSVQFTFHFNPVTISNDFTSVNSIVNFTLAGVVLVMIIIIITIVSKCFCVFLKKRRHRMNSIMIVEVNKTRDLAEALYDVPTSTTNDPMYDTIKDDQEASFYY